MLTSDSAWSYCRFVALYFDSTAVSRSCSRTAISSLIRRTHCVSVQTLDELRPAISMNDVLDALQLVNEYENLTVDGNSAAREYQFVIFEIIAE